MENMRAKRSEYRTWKKGYYHLCTDGWKEGKIFNNDRQFRFGMTVIGLIGLLFSVQVYAFTLMPNHIHIILSGTGDDCVKVFSYLRRKLSRLLASEGDPPLPGDYGFKLIPIENEEQMKANILYLFRNSYEKGWAQPGCYPWGSGWTVYSPLSNLIRGSRADSFSRREVSRMTGSEIQIPSHWEFHPQIGLLPTSHIHNKLVYKLFPSVKAFTTRLVKDYEAFINLSSALDESVSFSNEELAEIVNTILRDDYNGKSLNTLTHSEMGRLVLRLKNGFLIDIKQISSCTGLPVQLVRQLLNAKDAQRF